MAIHIILALLLITTPAEAAPVAAAGAAVFGFFTSGGIGSIIGSLLLSAAFSVAASLLTRGPTGSGSQQQPEQRLSTRQAIPPRRYLVGEVLTGGALFFEECKPPWLFQGLLISQGPVEGLFGVQVVQNPIGVNPANGAALTSPYTGYLNVRFAPGTATQAVDSLLLSEFPAVTSNFRQQGIARVVIRANYGENQERFVELWGQQQKPLILLTVRGIKVYDPRDPTQVLPADPNDKAQYDAAYATWKWTDNASLIIANFLWNSDCGRVPLDTIRWDRIAESATYDDGLMGTKEGVQLKRHTINGVVTSDQAPYGVFERMLRSNRGMICRHQGETWVQSSQPQQSILTITDNHIVGGISYRRSQPKQDLIRRLRVRFVDPRQEWAMVDGPVRTEAGWDGKYENTLELPFTVDHRRAQRLQVLAMREAELGKQVITMVSTQTLGDTHYGELIAGRSVRIQSDVVSRANGLYRIQEVSFVENLSALQLTLKEYDPSIEGSYNPATDEQDYTLPVELN